MENKIKLVLPVAIVLLLTSCISVISEANTNYSEINLGKTLVIAKFYTKRNIIGKENIDFYNNFALNTETVFQEKYNISANVIVLNNNKFEDVDIEEEIKNYGSDFLIEIQQSETILDEHQSEVLAIYKVIIYDIAKGEKIWQGEMTLDPPARFAESLSNSIISTIEKNQLKDGLNLFGNI